MDDSYKRLNSQPECGKAISFSPKSAVKRPGVVRRSKTLTFSSDAEAVRAKEALGSSFSKPLLAQHTKSCEASLGLGLPDGDCPLTPVTHHSSQSASGEAEVALYNMRETKQFNLDEFDDVTGEAYYSVHRLRGTVIFRVVEMASQDEGHLPLLDEVLGLLHEREEQEIEAASLAVYEHYGTNSIHAMHLAASLGSVEVMKRLVAHYGNEVIDLHSTITREEPTNQKRGEEPAASVNSLSSMKSRMSFPAVRSNTSGPFHMASMQRVNSTDVTRDHYTPLLSALYMSRTEAVIWLLDNNADPNLANIDGQTAIHLLAKCGLPHESVWKQDEAIERLAIRLVECNADVDARTNNVEHLPKWQCGKTALQLAASKMSQYPKHLLFLLAKSFQTPELSEPLKELTLIAQVNPTAAESLMEMVRSSRTVRKQLLLEVHMRDTEESLDNIVEVMRTAAPAAADLLEMLTFRPQVKSLQKNPLPPYARLENRQMLCTYKPDVSEGVPQRMLQENAMGAGHLPMPIWDYADPRIPWHKKFQTAADHNLIEESKVYKVEMKVLHLPNVLNFRVPHALYSLSDSTQYLEIFGRIPVQAIVECLWESVRWAHWLNITIEVLVMGMLLLIGYVPPDETLHPTDSKLGSVIVAKVIFDFVNTVSIVYRMRWQSNESLWVLFCRGGWAAEIMCSIPLVILVVHANKGDDLAVSFDGAWEVLIAVNLFMRGLCLLRLSRSLRGFGETVISVQKSIPKISNMVLLMSLVFINFACIFLTLKDKDKTAEYILLYLWLGMIFGEGDGIENISGFDTDQSTYTGGGNQVVIQASILFMIVASFLFAVVLMNLMIAIYSNYYEEMVPMAPFHFQKMRAKDCACYMLRLSWPPCCFSTIPRLKVFRRCAFLATALLMLLWLTLERRTGWGWCLGVLLAFALLQFQATLLIHKWHAGPDDQRLYLWVCHRADFYEVAGGTTASWQRYVRGELTGLQKEMQGMKSQMEALTKAVMKIAGDDSPTMRGPYMRRTKTWSATRSLSALLD